MYFLTSLCYCNGINASSVIQAWFGILCSTWRFWNNTILISFCWGLFSGLGMVFHNLYSLRAKGQNPLCGKPSAVIHSHTPRTDWSSPFCPWVWCQGKWFHAASICVPKCSYCVSPILLCKTCKGVDLRVLRMWRRKRGDFLESLVFLLWLTIFLDFFFNICPRRGQEADSILSSAASYVHRRQTSFLQPRTVR